MQQPTIITLRRVNKNFKITIKMGTKQKVESQITKIDNK